MITRACHLSTCAKLDELHSTLPSCFFKMNIYTIIQSISWSSNWPLAISYSKQNLVYICLLHHVCHMSSPFYSFDRPNFDKEYKLYTSCNYPQSPVTASLLDPTVLLKIPFIITLSFYPSPKCER